MSLDASDPRLARTRERVAPYAWMLIERAGEHALRLHADSVTPEHLVSVLMEDPDCAASALVLHAFADPATIAADVLAISPGVMVVASEATLPFSADGVAALWHAHAEAQRATGSVEARQLLDAALRALGAAPRSALRLAGLTAGDDGSAGDAMAATAGEHLFKPFSMTAKRALSNANRLAAAARHAAIGPAHIVLGCLKAEPALEGAVEISFQRARLALASTLEDRSVPPPRRIPADPVLIEFLDGLNGGLSGNIDSLALLARCHAGTTPELAQVLTRHKVSTALLEQGRTAFRDPAVPA